MNCRGSCVSMCLRVGGWMVRMEAYVRKNEGTIVDAPADELFRHRRSQRLVPRLPAGCEGIGALGIRLGDAVLAIDLLQHFMGTREVLKGTTRRVPR